MPADTVKTPCLDRLSLSSGPAYPPDAPANPGHPPPPYNQRPRVKGKRVDIPITYGMAIPTRKANPEIAPICFPLSHPWGALPARRKLLAKRRARLAAKTQTDGPTE